ncbi:unnamed protein product [Caenorhabditis auriculariae]|uniref:Uncharacterized protein n=1 Tax=Caenorhabditis auriculariae TaxID=2777116 RepID=A0A8S1GW20_9PELO|nr:unnamed protein product [Caenorhabditis auriculariae]
MPVAPVAKIQVPGIPPFHDPNCAEAFALRGLNFLEELKKSYASRPSGYDEVLEIFASHALNNTPFEDFLKELALALKEVPRMIPLLEEFLPPTITLTVSGTNEVDQPTRLTVTYRCYLDGKTWDV